MRASTVVARSIPPGPLSPAAAQQRNLLIRGIAWELDKLALPLRMLIEACHPVARHNQTQPDATSQKRMEDPAVPDGEVFRTALTRATDALSRFGGRPS